MNAIKSFALALAAVVTGLSLSAVPEPVKPDTAAKPGEKFDVYLLAGQSNMAGRGKLNAKNRIDTTRIFKWNCWEAKGVGNAWIPATEPVVSDRGFSGACLGTSFARALADADPALSVGLVPSAEGGSELARWMPGKDLYNRAINQTRAALKNGGKLKAILWHQGCADGGNMKLVDSYATRLATIVAAMRKDLDAPDVPFIAGELGEYLDQLTGKNAKGETYLQIPFWKKINEQIHAAQKTIPNMYVVKANGLKDKGDHLHFSTEALRTLGLRYLDAYKQAIKK